MADQAMSFYHGKGLVPTWKLAQQYIGKDGRIATVPDIFDARLATEPGSFPWERYFTTLTAEYVGIGSEGKKIIIVAHGIGPMSTLDGITAAYKYEYGDKTRHNDGGQVSAEEFRKLEAGEYGQVFVVDFDRYAKRYEYTFNEIIRASSAMNDQLLIARLGGAERTDAYVSYHQRHAAQWHEEQAETDPEDRYGLGQIDPENRRNYLRRRRQTHEMDAYDPHIIAVEASARYRFDELEEGGPAIAHLLSVARLVHVTHEGHESMAFDIDTHTWTNGCRFVGVPAAAVMDSIHPDWNASAALAKHWDKLLVPLEGPAAIDFCALTKLGEDWFTQYPSTGHDMATWEPQFWVTEIEAVGHPVDFTTEISGYYGFYRYDVQEVKAIAPPGANAFLMGEADLADDNHHRATVQFYRIKADTSARLRRAKELEGDFQTQMRLMSLTG